MEITCKAKGCLLLGALGDALGYAVEFDRIDEIRKMYGNAGIQDLSLTNGKAIISDDTQMTLFTADALLSNSSDVVSELHNYYTDWLWTQAKQFFTDGYQCKSKLCEIEGLNKNRAPGRTCLYSLAKFKMGTIENPINDSKGCGGVMRVAPIALYYCQQLEKTETEISVIAVQASAITHGHELGYIPSFCLVNMLVRIMRTNDILDSIVWQSISDTKEYFAKSVHTSYFVTLMEKAIELSKLAIDDVEAITQIGEGWVAEETLAIAVYCALKYKDDSKKVLIAAVNHNGDSDSTGSVAGNIIGAYLGYDSIDKEWTSKLEFSELITSFAEKLIANVG